MIFFYIYFLPREKRHDLYKNKLPIALGKLSLSLGDFVEQMETAIEKRTNSEL